jgi:cytosine/adenosine deaminase-related metal-dependent hydrolase
LPDQVFYYIEMLNAELPPGERLVELAVAPHSAYACDDRTLIHSSRCAQRLGIPLLMHAQETPDEMGRPQSSPPPSSFYRTRPGVQKNPLVHLDDLGFFEPGRILLAHCIYLQQDEIEILSRRGAGVSYNGLCNTQIGLAIAPVTEMRKKGIAVGIGTDGPLTNDRLDLVSQLLPLLCFQRHREASGHMLSCYDMVQMATIEGARAIGLADRIGSIEKGKKADIIAFSLHAHPRWPLYLNNGSVYTFIVKNLASGQADFCLIDGKAPRTGSLEELLGKLDPALQGIRAWRPGK